MFVHVKRCCQGVWADCCQDHGGIPSANGRCKCLVNAQMPSVMLEAICDAGGGACAGTGPNLS